MNNNVVAIIFFLVFGVASFAAGAYWMRNRIWESTVERVYEKAVSSVFKTAVRAQTKMANSGAGRFRPPGRVFGRSRPVPPPSDPTLEEEATIVIDFPTRHRANESRVA